MFGSNFISQRNSQSCYEGSIHPSLFESYNLPQNNNPYPASNSNIPNQNSNFMSQNPLIFSQFSNMSNNSISGGRKNTQQSFTSTNFINYKQFENIFIEKIKNFPNQVNEYLTKEEENINLKLLMDSVNNTSLLTCQNINKINDTYRNKLSNSNFCVPQLFEICSKINEILNNIDNELLQQFSFLTSFHGYDESVQNNEKINLNKIQNIINECNELLNEKIIKIDNNSMNFNNEINSNCEQFRIILGQEMYNLNQNLNELLNYKNEKNTNYDKYQQITDNIIKTVNSIKNKFIFYNSNTGNENEEKICTQNENKENIINNNLNENKQENLVMDKAILVSINESCKEQNRMATLKIINEMHNRNKNRKRKKNNFFK